MGCQAAVDLFQHVPPASLTHYQEAFVQALGRGLGHQHSRIRLACLSALQALVDQVITLQTLMLSLQVHLRTFSTIPLGVSAAVQLEALCLGCPSAYSYSHGQVMQWHLIVQGMAESLVTEHVAPVLGQMAMDSTPSVRAACFSAIHLWLSKPRFALCDMACLLACQAGPGLPHHERKGLTFVNQL